MVRVELDSPYWVPAPGTLDEAAEEALAHHPKCECDTCRPDLAAWHHADCQCTDCQPGMWAAAPAAVSTEFPGISLGLLAYDIADLLDRGQYPIGAADSDIEPALPGFLRAILANTAADYDDWEAGAMHDGGHADRLADSPSGPARDVPVPHHGRARRWTYLPWSTSQGVELGSNVSSSPGHRPPQAW